mgnify:CR=1 FL=1
MGKILNKDIPFSFKKSMIKAVREKWSRIMGRFYQLSKKISEQEVTEIMREVLELPDIKDAEIVDGKVRVETKDNAFVDVMSTVVNIFRRVAGGCELSFVGFAYKD